MAGGRRKKEDDVIQLRRRQRVDNPFLGVSPLVSLAKEVWIDQEAEEMSAAILKNLGIVGLMISPKGSSEQNGIDISDDDVESMRKYLRENYSGDNRAETMFAAFPMDVHSMTAANGEQMHPKAIHDFVEERVCALYRLPASVVQFGIGLEQTTENATLEQYEKQAWETGLIPVGDPIAEQMSRQLLPPFELDSDMYRLQLDYSGVEVLQDKLGELALIWGGLLNTGAVLRSTVLEKLGLPFTDADKVRHMPINIVEVPEGMTQLASDEERRDAMTSATS